jgi:hypothetical protein
LAHIMRKTLTAKGKSDATTHPAPRAAGEGNRHGRGTLTRVSDTAPRRGDPGSAASRPGTGVVVDLAADAALWCRQPQQPRHRTMTKTAYRKGRFDDHDQPRAACGGRKATGTEAPAALRGSATPPHRSDPQIRGPGWPARPRSGFPAPSPRAWRGGCGPRCAGVSAGGVRPRRWRGVVVRRWSLMRVRRVPGRPSGGMPRAVEHPAADRLRSRQPVAALLTCRAGRNVTRRCPGSSGRSHRP